MAHESAIRTGKGQTMGRCVFTGMVGVDGAHWYSARKYPQLADVPEVVFAMRRDHHWVLGKPCFDWKQIEGVDIERPVSERRWMLENMTLDEFRGIIRKKIHVVGLWCMQYNIEFPAPERPTDYEELVNQGRLC